MRHIFFRKRRRSHSTSGAVFKHAQLLSANRQEALNVHSDPHALFIHIHERAMLYGDSLINALSADLRQGQLSQLATLWELVPFYTGVVATAQFALAQVQAPPPCPCAGLIPAIPDYCISTRFLTMCHHFLMGDPQGHERLHLVTGIKLSESAYTLDYMEKVAHSQQSLTHATADQTALNRALIELDSFGLQLHGLFHRHPGTGAGSTCPSKLDLTTHKRFESGGYPLIGAIFVEDGYVRFFSNQRPFTLTLYGTGVKPVPGETHVYKIHLPAAGYVSREASAAEANGRVAR